MRSRRMLDVGVMLTALTLLTGCRLGKKDGSSEGGVFEALADLADAGSAAPKKAVVSTITFKKKNPAVGSSFIETASTDMKLDITSPRKSTSTLKEKMTSKIDILGTDNKTILKAKVTYTEHAKSTTDDAKAKTDVSPVVGKTYLVELKDKKVLVTDEKITKKVSAKEEKVVRGDLDDVVGKPDPLLTELPDIAMNVGDKADSLAEALRDLLSGDDKIDFSETSVRLREIGTAGTEKVGTFDVKTKVTISGGAKIVIDLTGTMTVRESDAKLAAIALQGPIALAAGVVKGNGTVAASQTRTY